MCTKRIFPVLLSFLFLLNSCSTFKKNVDLKNHTDRSFYSQKKKLQETARLLLSKSKYESAGIILDSLIQLSADAWVYKERGKLYMRQEGSHQQAEWCFKKAIEFDPDDAENYCQLGTVYQRGPYSNFLAVESFRKAIARRPYYREAYFQLALSIFEDDYTWGLSPLEELILIDPNYKNAYEIYIKVCTAFYEFNRLNSLLEKMLIKYPLNPQYQLDFVNVLYRDGEFEKALEMLRIYQSRFAYHAISLQDLYEAKIRFALNQDTLGHQLYWQGVETTVSGKECDAFFKDMVYLATDEEYDAYRFGNPELKKGLLYSFWKSRDPTMTTSFNERIPEHYRRLRYVHKYNRRYPEKESLDYFLNDFSEPVERSKNTLMELYSGTKGSKCQQEVDDMGLIYIRHGEPDIKETYIAVEAQTNVSWLYFEKPERPSMVFHFRIKDSREKSASMTDGYRLELQPLYKQRDFITIPSDSSYITLATVTETFDLKPPNGIFEFASRIYTFRGKNKKQDVYVWYEIPQTAITINERQENIIYQETILFDTYWQEIGRQDRSEFFNSGDSFPVMRKFKFSLSDDTYYIGIHQHNEQNLKRGEKRIRADVPWIHPFLLQVSSIMMGDVDSNIALLEVESHDRNMAAQVVPNIKSEFLIRDPIFLYYEIYNLTQSDDGTNFTVTVRVTQKERFLPTMDKIVQAFQTPDADSKPVEIGFSDTFTGDRLEEFLTRSISLVNYSPGIYELMVEVRDNHSSQTASSQTEFQLKK